jgi:hypothetical protein
MSLKPPTAIITDQDFLCRFAAKGLIYGAECESGSPLMPASIWLVALKHPIRNIFGLGVPGSHRLVKSENRRLLPGGVNPSEF